MGLRQVKVTKQDVVRIELLDKNPQHGDLIEWRHGDTEKLVDLPRLQKRLEELAMFTAREVERIMDRLYNFRLVYINLITREVTT